MSINTLACSCVPRNPPFVEPHYPTPCPYKNHFSQKSTLAEIETFLMGREEPYGGFVPIPTSEVNVRGDGAWRIFRSSNGIRDEIVGKTNTDMTLNAILEHMNAVLQSDGAEITLSGERFQAEDSVRVLHFGRLASEDRACLNRVVNYLNAGTNEE